MLRCQFIALVDQCEILVVITEFFVGNINDSRQPGKVDIYPVGVSCFLVAENGIGGNDAIDRVFKSEGKARFIETLVYMRRRRIYPEIAGRLGWIDSGPAGSYQY